MAEDDDIEKCNSKCIKCSQVILSDEKVLKCSSFCDSVIHQACTIFKPTEIRLIEKYPNITWLCNVCEKTNNSLGNKLQNFASILNNCMSEIIQMKAHIEAQNANIELLTIQNNSIKEKLAETSIVSNYNYTEVGKPVIDTTKVDDLGDTNTNNHNSHIVNENKNCSEHKSTSTSTTSDHVAPPQTKMKTLNNTLADIVKRSKPVSENIRKQINSISTVVDTELQSGNFQKPMSSTQAISNDAGDGFVLPKRKNARRYNNSYSNIVGSNETTGNFRAASKKAWYFLGRVNANTNTIDIINYVKKFTQSSDVTCEKISNESTTNCFKISVDFSLRAKMENPDAWPSGIVLRRYIFRRQASKHPSK